MKCECGNDMFYAKQKVYVDTDVESRSEIVSLDIIVDENNNWLDNVDEDYDNISDAENPESPYFCTKCGKQYDKIRE
jgi:hypothetical protein